MDHRRFDTFTRALAQLLDRREGLAAVLALLIAVLIGDGVTAKKNGGAGRKSRGKEGGKGRKDKNSNKKERKNKRRKKRRRRGRGERDCDAIPLKPGADLHECDLREHPELASADFTNAQLEDSILSGAVLAGVSFRGARLWRARLDGANLTNARFENSGGRKTDVFGVDFSEADLTDATLDFDDVLYAKYAVFCQTTMPNGELNSSSCANG